LLLFSATPMVYVDSWDEFVERSVQLFRGDPNAVRPSPDPLSSSLSFFLLVRVSDPCAFLCRPAT
jgi:hypothetical protein